MWRLKGGVGNGMEFDTHANVSFSAGELELRANLLTVRSHHWTVPTTPY